MTDELAINVAVMRQEIANNKDLISKLTSTSERISETAAYIAKLVAVHETRLDRAEQQISIADNRLEDHRKSILIDMQAMNVQLTQLHLDLVSDLKQLEERISIMIETITSQNTDSATSYRMGIDDRIRALENWKWMVLGGGVVIGFLLGKIPTFLTFFKTLM